MYAIVGMCLNAFMQKVSFYKKHGPRWDATQPGHIYSAVGNVSGYRSLSDCRARGHEFDPGPVPYFHGDWSWNNFCGYSPPVG